MSEQPRSSDPSVERLEALSAKWRKEAARWRTDDETPYAYEWADTQENCADELDAVLSSLASSAVPSTGEGQLKRLALLLKERGWSFDGRMFSKPGIDADYVGAVMSELESAAPSDPPAPAAFPMDGVWRCEDCGEAGPQLDARWRWAGDRWQHHHEYPVGHIDARYFGPAPAAPPELERLVLNLQAHAREHGWQDCDEPIAALLAWQPSAPAASSGAAPRELPADIKRVREVAHAFREGYRAGYADGDCGEVEDAESAWDRSASSSLLTQPAAPPERPTPAASKRQDRP